MKQCWFTFVALLFVAARAEAQRLDPAACANNICKIIAYGHASDLHFRDFADFRPRLIEFYAPSYAPAWLADGKVTQQALTLIDVLKAADKKGLRPEDYDADLWDEQI